MTLPFGAVVVSLRTDKLRGRIVGYGVLQWPGGTELSGDDGIPQPVYLVQLSDGPMSFVRGSSSLGPACAVLRADQVEEVER